MRTTPCVVFAFIASLLVASCADTTPPGEDPDTGIPCEAGTKSCDNNVYKTCVDGKLVEEDCGSKTCFLDYGCKLCTPKQGYCDGQDTYQCSDDGESSQKTGSCKPEQQCVAGQCIDLCDDPNRKKSNVGCHFWAVDMPNEYYCLSIDGGATCGLQYGCAACQPVALAVSNTSTYEVNVVVEINEAKPGEPLKLKKIEEKVVGGNGIALIMLPMREVDCTEWEKDATGKMRRKNSSQSCVSSRAFRVTSSYPVVVYQFNPLINQFSNGASLLIPRVGLDKDYYVIGWPTTNPIAVPIPGQAIEGVPDFTNITIIGTEEDTEVTVTPTHPIQQSPDGKVPAAKAGETFKVKLGPFDVLNINSIQDFANITGDLTGTRVTADKKIAVFSGAQRASAPLDLSSYSPPPSWPEPADNCCTEHFEQQMFPISALGKRFAITRTPVRAKVGAEPDFYRVLATEDKTLIKTSLPEFPTIPLAKAGDSYNFWAITGFILESDKPLMLVQIAASQGFVGDIGTSGGDPEFVAFPPVEQYRKDYVFLTPPTFTHDYVVISTPANNSVELDGKSVNEEFSTICKVKPIGKLDGVDYRQLTCELPVDGPHRVKAKEPVGITVYGYYGVGSYGFPGGADIREINIK